MLTIQTPLWYINLAVAFRQGREVTESKQKTVQTDYGKAENAGS